MSSRSVQSQDYEGFFERELESRRQLGYPPFTRLALVRLSGPLDATVAQEARRLAAALENLRTRDHDLRSRVRILGRLRRASPASRAGFAGKS